MHRAHLVNVLRTAVLLVAIGAVALVFHVRPVGAFPERRDIATAACSNTELVTVRSRAAHELCSVTTTRLSAAHNHICTLIASASASRGLSGAGRFIFGLAIDGFPNQIDADRTIEFTNLSEADERLISVSTNVTVAVAPGQHTFRFNARKSVDSASNIGVFPSNLSVICMPKRA